MKRKLLLIGIPVVSIVVLLLSAYLTYYFYLKPNDEVAQAFNDGTTNLIIEGNIIDGKDKPKIVEEEVMLPIDMVRKYFDPNISWDESLKKVTVTTKDRVIRMKTDNLNAVVNNKPIQLKIPVTVENNVIFIPIEFLADFYNIEITRLKENNIIIIDYKNSIRQIAETISPDAVIRRERNIRSPILKKFNADAGQSENNSLRVFDEYDKWYKVRTADGIVGYMEKKYVVVRRMLVTKLPELGKEGSEWKPEKGKVNLVWEMMYNKRPDLTKINKMDGLDVISPTWFQVADEKGTLINRADAKYVEWAHANGYKVWALLANDFSSAASTKKLLANADARDNIIRQMLAFASLYKLDGINIDFENINKDDKNALTQFVREITPLLKEQGLVVSMDVTIPDGSDNWSLCYDRQAIGQVVDYVMLMAYDQHWSTSPKAGSVAQITWVESNLKKTLSQVPKEKLLLGLPFYTRMWKEEADKDGKIKVTNQVLTMEAAKKAVKDNNATVKWDEESGQFYAEYKKDNATYKVWIEDENSINVKSSLVQKYKLAGAAAWRRSDETLAVWGVLNKNLKVFENYQEWALENSGKKVALN